jgi:Zn-dependent peptidase ImmA (M78 family)/DNA-binding XRE family transcriptional regulator
MAASIPALVNAPLLVWAREEAGYSIEEAALRAHFPVEKLTAWERGDAKPTLRQAQKLGKLYQRPFTAFYLPEPPKTPPLAADYRRLPGIKPGAESPALRLALRLLIYRRGIALDLIDELGDKPDAFPLRAHLNEDPERVAERLRARLGIAIETQWGWASEFAAWPAWRAAVEALDVLVFQFSKVDPEEVRGVSLLHFPLPAIGINSREIPASKPFTLLHELTHVMLARADEEKPALLERRPKQAWAGVERFAEGVAGAVLMPAKVLLNDPGVAGRPTTSDWSVPEIRRLARRYKVTPSAMATRLLRIGRCSPAAYRRWKDAWDQHLQEHPPKTGGGITTPAAKALNRNGRPLTQLVLEALALDRITCVDAAHFLDLRFTHFEDLRRELMGRPDSTAPAMEHHA